MLLLFGLPVVVVFVVVVDVDVDVFSHYNYGKVCQTSDPNLSKIYPKSIPEALRSDK